MEEEADDEEEDVVIVDISDEAFGVFSLGQYLL
jgi:hypothetical protein